MSGFDKRIYGEKMRRTSLILIQLLICTLLLGTLTFAHGGMEHILGTVIAITEHSLSVKTREGATKTVEFDGETKFVKGDAAATIKDVQVGSRVVIHAHDRDRSLHAAEVRIGTDAAPGQR
jgi:hypothetical protein